MFAHLEYVKNVNKKFDANINKKTDKQTKGIVRILLNKRGRSLIT